MKIFLPLLTKRPLKKILLTAGILFSSYNYSPASGAVNGAPLSSSIKDEMPALEAAQSQPNSQASTPILAPSANLAAPDDISQAMSPFLQFSSNVIPLAEYDISHEERHFLSQLSQADLQNINLIETYNRGWFLTLSHCVSVPAVVRFTDFFSHLSQSGRHDVIEWLLTDSCGTRTNVLHDLMYNSGRGTHSGQSAEEHLAGYLAFLKQAILFKNQRDFNQQFTDSVFLRSFHHQGRQYHNADFISLMLNMPAIFRPSLEALKIAYQKAIIAGDARLQFFLSNYLPSQEINNLDNFFQKNTYTDFYSTELNQNLLAHIVQSVNPAERLSYQDVKDCIIESASLGNDDQEAIDTLTLFCDYDPRFESTLVSLSSYVFKFHKDLFGSWVVRWLIPFILDKQEGVPVMFQMIDVVKLMFERLNILDDDAIGSMIRDTQEKELSQNRAKFVQEVNAFKDDLMADESGQNIVRFLVENNLDLNSEVSKVKKLILSMAIPRMDLLNLLEDRASREELFKVSGIFLSTFQGLKLKGNSKPVQ